ncbi:hypothetical protein Ciccas_001063 [Cichlidogyrus casuarinus]|uniref:Uncharacterized protein n=1 Tax=Cichlidogyrus casuarinus TaxID=1844966 RepID=A0ABD2QP39_9PLAT
MGRKKCLHGWVLSHLCCCCQPRIVRKPKVTVVQEKKDLSNKRLDSKVRVVESDSDTEIEDPKLSLTWEGVTNPIKEWTDIKLSDRDFPMLSEGQCNVYLSLQILDDRINRRFSKTTRKFWGRTRMLASKSLAIGSLGLIQFLKENEKFYKTQLDAILYYCNSIKKILSNYLNASWTFEMNKGLADYCYSLKRQHCSKRTAITTAGLLMAWYRKKLRTLEQMILSHLKNHQIAHQLEVRLAYVIQLLWRVVYELHKKYELNVMDKNE